MNFSFQALGKSPGGKPFVPFQVPLTQSFAKDSAVAIYWNEQDVKPKQARELGFTYGLYSLKEAGRIAVTIAGDLSLKGEMTVVALVNDPKTNETLTLRLPPELRLVEGQETQLVPPAAKGRPSPVTWRVRSVAEGTFPVEARSSTNDAKVKRVRIRASGLF